MSLRVLHVAPAFYPAVIYGGPTESTYRLTVALAEHAGCEIEVLTTDANGPETLNGLPASRIWTPVPRMRVTYCHRTTGNSLSIEMIRKLPAAIRAADLVHLMAVYSAPTIPTLALCRAFGKPLVWSPRGALQRWAGSRRRVAKSWWEGACRLIADGNVTLHFTSEEERTASMARFPNAAAVVIPNGVNVPEEIRRVEDSTYRIGFLGRLDPIKGLENLIEACAQLRMSIPWRLTLAGSGTQAYEHLLDTRIRAANLADRVRRLGQLAPADRAAFFGDIDVLVLPSYSENFGIVVAEALAHGVPVIASTGTPWSKLADIGCGLFVSNQPGSLAQAIAQMADCDRRVMGQRGREWMLREFSWRSIAGRLASAYERLYARNVCQAQALDACDGE